MPPDLAASLSTHRRALWALCYRMTGSSADADDLVQETLTRAIERPPKDLHRDIKPWLMKVALNLSRDALRRRQARSYIGPWLPAPIVTGDEGGMVDLRIATEAGTAGRYALMESVSLGFLVALEALRPKQRAVLLLRDVFDYTSAETADALDLSVSDVKVSLHRARARMARYDAQRRPPSPSLTERTRTVLGRLLFALGNQDHAEIQAVLAEEAAAYSDSAGEFLSARRVVKGQRNVGRLISALASKRTPAGIEPVVVNGAPGFDVRFARCGPRDAPRAILAADLDVEDNIRSLYMITATTKLRAAKDGSGPFSDPADDQSSSSSSSSS